MRPAPTPDPRDLLRHAIERERALQRGVTHRIVAPVDAVFDMLTQTASMLQRQAEALESAGEALTETAALVKAQAELFERTVGAVRQPIELVEAAARLAAGRDHEVET